MELWDETPTAAQAAVGVSVCGRISVDPQFNVSSLLLSELAMGKNIALESDERPRLVTNLLRELMSAFAGLAAL